MNRRADSYRGVFIGGLGLERRLLRDRVFKTLRFADDAPFLSSCLLFVPFYPRRADSDVTSRAVSFAIKIFKRDKNLVNRCIVEGVSRGSYENALREYVIRR